jgi:hypothetical protein
MVVMAHAVSDRPEVVVKVLRAGEGITPEASDPWPSGVVKALKVIGWPRFLGHRFGVGGWHAPGVGVVLSRVKGGLLPLRRREVGPQLCGALTAPLANLAGHALARGGVHRQPAPGRVRRLLDNAAPLVRLNVQVRAEHRLGRGCGLDLHMVGPGRQAGAPTVHEPAEVHPHHTANAVAGDGLAPQAFPQGTVLGRPEALRRA